MFSPTHSSSSILGLLRVPPLVAATLLVSPQPTIAQESAVPPSASAAPATNATAQKLAGTKRDGKNSSADIYLLRNQVYATVDNQPLLCDVYYPVPPQTETTGNPVSFPAVVLVHGGGWASGDKWAVTNFARSLAEAGIVAMAINYRHAPQYKFPTQVDDCREALIWLNENAEQFHVDRQRLGMFGYSAGAHLSCMLGTLNDADWQDIAPTTQWLQNDPRWERLPKLRCIVGGGAPCDFRDLPEDNTAIAYFLGGSRREVPEIYRAASPVSHASAGDVPTLFIHGSRDLIVPLVSSRVLYEAQLRAGVPSRFVAIEGLGHMLAFIHPKTLEETRNYFSELLQAQAAPVP
jgi:triacylglycerol lipase